MKSALYALAVAVLMGTMAVAALADDLGTSLYESGDYNVSSQPEQGVEPSDAGEIREPMETGAVPEHSLGSSVPHFISAGSSDPTFWPGGP
jgi:hypothetical protein